MNDLFFNSVVFIGNFNPFIVYYYYAVLFNYIAYYKKQKKKAALIYGPTGVGKTCSVYAIANDNDLEIIEVNASDFRNKDKIDQVIGNALRQGSLFGRPTLGS